jgi:predicted ATPase/DNA-binding winged helix-turn-helix (wHTH) protein
MPLRQPEHSAAVEFGRFRLVRHRRELLVDGRPVELGGRAFDMLIALVDAGGSVLTKDDLMRRVWPGQVVEESNLPSQISALRKALGADRDLIRTVAGRGYQFTGEVRRRAKPADGGAARTTNLPEPASELIGRESEIAEVRDLVGRHRMVTLVGTGGIGKTRLGLTVAREALPRFRDGVFVAELGPLSNPELVPATVATALGLTFAGSVSGEGVATAAGGKHLLLILDNCEHVVDAAAGMAAALLRANPAASILATSREPLRVDAEHVYRVPPLEVPAEDNANIGDVLTYGAVKLFVSRAHAAEPRYVPDDRLAAMTAAICRRLDGIPLALELAAARVAAFGVEGVVAGLDDRFRLLTGGSRTALRRHQTLRATLDWSHELLTAADQVVFRRLAVFAGAFTLHAASAVAASADMPAPEVIDSLANLVGKSLVSADVVGPSVRYRLLETTRAYAREKAADSRELARCERRHAEYHRELFERAEAEWQMRPTGEWIAEYGPHIDNLRAALDWAFAPEGDVAVGVALATAAVPLWVSLSLLDEYRAHVERALAALESDPRPDARRRMQLHAAVGWWLVYTRGPARETSDAWATTLELAEGLGDSAYRLRALWGLWAGVITNGDIRTGLELATRFSGAAEHANPADRSIGDRMVGASLHYLGDQSGARRHLTRARAPEGGPQPPPGTPARLRVASLSSPPWLWWPRAATGSSPSVTPALARVLWLQGCADQAMRAVERIVDEALSIDHTLSLCNVLIQAACPVALWTGDLPAAERFTAALLDRTTRHGLDVFQVYGRCFKGMLQMKCGDADAGLPLLDDAVGELRRESRWAQFHTALCAWLAEGCLGAGQVTQGLSAIDEAMARSTRTGERWIMPELLRIRGELLLRNSEVSAAEDHFLQALDWARRQEALAWELRGATSLARLRERQHRTSQARKALQPVYERFTEGFSTADLITARALLDTLS